MSRGAIAYRQLGREFIDRHGLGKKDSNGKRGKGGKEKKGG
jgi:hypothetical protein